MVKTPKQIAQKRRRLEASISKASQALSELQKECNHSGDLTYKFNGSSGNYDRSQDSYWIEWKCNDCGERWNTTQENIHHQTKIQYPNSREIREREVR
jgi:hypothetical protein